MGCMYVFFQLIFQIQNNKITMAKPNHAMQEIRDWWTDQLAYQSSSDEE